MSKLQDEEPKKLDNTGDNMIPTGESAHLSSPPLEPNTSPPVEHQAAPVQRLGKKKVTFAENATHTLTFAPKSDITLKKVSRRSPDHISLPHMLEEESALSVTDEARYKEEYDRTPPIDLILSASIKTKDGKREQVYHGVAQVIKKQLVKKDILPDFPLTIKALRGAIEKAEKKELSRIKKVR